ncbi:peroxidase 51-like [Phragmites australis]|uniref:peroxidase 51-like n=1 Tax=Phragmites australis TaxID=29695 RepID=UPI002D769606|nr:peroxidase 51-like [Phragmites australis]
MGAGIRILAALLALASAAGVVTRCAAQLRQDYYAAVCPDVESIVRDAVSKKVQETPVAVGATLRLFFHDCFVEGCDASVILVSTGNNTAEKDHPTNLSLAGDGFDTVIKAKAAIDAVPQCTNQVSCADILAMATRDVIALAGGPSYAVELGRLDGLSSTSTSVDGKLPPPSFNLDQLTSLFAANNLSQTDMIALSAAHTVGFAHCSTFSSRIQPAAVDPTMDPTYATDLLAACPAGVDPNVALENDPITPHVFDIQYFVNLVNGRGLFTSDQVLYSDTRSQPNVIAWSQNATDFEQAFVAAMTNLGRVGVKTDPSQGNIRRDCAFLS